MRYETISAPILDGASATVTYYPGTKNLKIDIYNGDQHLQIWKRRGFEELRDLLIQALEKFDRST